MKKSTSKNQIYIGDEMKCYLVALIEENRAAVKAICEKSGLRRKVDQDEFDALVRRVSVIEKRAK